MVLFSVKNRLQFWRSLASSLLFHETRLAPSKQAYSRQRARYLYKVSLGLSLWTFCVRHPRRDSDSSRLEPNKRRDLATSQEYHFASLLL